MTQQPRVHFLKYSEAIWRAETLFIVFLTFTKPAYIVQPTCAASDAQQLCTLSAFVKSMIIDCVLIESLGRSTSSTFTQPGYHLTPTRGTKYRCVLCGLGRRELRLAGPIERKRESEGVHECGMDGSERRGLTRSSSRFPVGLQGSEELGLASFFLERSRDFPVARSCSSYTCLEYKTETYILARHVLERPRSRVAR